MFKRLPLSLREAVHLELVTTPSNAAPTTLFISGRITQAAYIHESLADFAAAISNVGGRHAVFNKPCPLRGYVTFNLSKPRDFESIEIVLLGKHYFIDPDLPGHPLTPAQVAESLQHRLNLLEGRPDGHFEPGNHRLDFNIVVPAETPPSFACQYGGQAYTLQVVAKDDDGATFKSSKRELTLINITPSFDQNDYLANLSGNHDQLGTFMARFRGYPATVGCVTLFQFTMQQPTPGTTLLGFQLSLVQIYKLRYEAKRGEDGHKTSKVDRSIESKYNLLKAWNTQKGIQIANDFPIFSKRPRALQAKEVVECGARIRLPLHHEILPSTPASLADSPITVSHRMQLEFQIRLANGITKALTYKRTIYLLSCRCSADTIVTPPYTQSESSSSARGRGGSRSQLSPGECACNTPDEKYQFPELDPEVQLEDMSEEARRLRDKLPNYEEATGSSARNGVP